MRKYESRIDAFQLKDKLLKEIYITLLQAALFYGEGISMADLMKVTGKTGEPFRNESMRYLEII